MGLKGISIKPSDLNISGQTAGDILYYNGTNWIRLAKGTADQTLRMNAGATAPEWDTVSNATSTLVVLDNHTATGNESTYTYTPSSALLFTTYSKIIIEIALDCTDTFNLQMVLNAVAGTSNDSAGFRWTGAAQADFSSFATTQLQIASSSLISNTISKCVSHIEFTAVDDDADAIMGHCISCGKLGENAELMNLSVAGIKTITSIETKSSASSWKIGSTITTYGVLRA